MDYFMPAMAGLMVGGFLGVIIALKVIVPARDDDDEDEVPAAPPTKPPPWTGMDLATWRERPHLIDWTIAMYSTPEWSRIMEVLWSQQPVALLSRDTDYPAQVGRAQGYREALAVLAELAKTPPVQPQQPAIDYSGDPLGEAHVDNP